MKTVTEMAREAGFDGMGRRVVSPVIEGSDLTWLLERFAELVRADERARMAHPEHHDPIGDAQDKLIAEQAAMLKRFEKH
jgi:hypothetical protein